MITLLSFADMIRTNSVTGIIVRDSNGDYYFTDKNYGDPIQALRNITSDWIKLEPNHLKAIKQIYKLRKLSLDDYERL